MRNSRKVAQVAQVTQGERIWGRGLQVEVKLG